MSFQAIAPAARGTEASAPKWPRFLQVLTLRACAEWPFIRADRSVQMLVRALAVAAAFAFALVAVLLSVPDNRERTRSTEPLTRTTRNGAESRRTAPPLFQLAHHNFDEVPLDSDFSMDEATRAWSPRVAEPAPALASQPEAEPDRRAESAPGVLQFGPVRVARAIVEHVVQAAKTTGSDPALLMAIADKESSFAPRAKASTSSASGLFQFIDSTWFKAVRLFGWRYGQEAAAKAIEDADGDRIAPQKRSEILKLRNDPYLSAVFAAELLKYDGDRIAERLGRPLTAGETYLIHFLGPEDAARFMQKVDEAPNTSAARLLPRPARANKPIFYGRQGRKMKDKSVGEVHEAFEAMMGQRSDRYKGVENKLPGRALAFTE